MAETHTPERFLEALRARGVARVRRVRFKDNRWRLLSVSRDRSTLHAHRCFQAAPEEVLDAIAVFLRAEPGTAEYRRAVERIRSWPGARDGLEESRRRAAARARTRRARPRGPGSCVATPEQRECLRALYAELNRRAFGGRLPEGIPIRLSGRMSRRYGHVRFDRGAGGERLVVEVALNVDLMLEGNERELVDTMLHELAHIEAWLFHGHAGHGAPWRRIARRVGCEPRACTRRAIRRRPAGVRRITRVPAVLLP